MRIGHIAATGAAAAALTLGAALPASADGHPDLAAAKPNPKVQVFEHPKVLGRYATFTRNVPNLPPRGWNRIGSAKNKGNRTVTFYRHTNYKGARFPLAPGEKVRDFGDHNGMHDGPGSLRFR
ncbi:beta/gamma crystallin-related protein [Streptomyces sp. NPDC050636]|uniref:beta/gamma crystallin-related protein n=1 Tax=Streptomyces sp. NPDC050636 TaxID=3154510 RepID=UPI0034479A0A